MSAQTEFIDFPYETFSPGWKHVENGAWKAANDQYEKTRTLVQAFWDKYGQPLLRLWLEVWQAAVDLANAVVRFVAEVKKFFGLLRHLW